jgi:hypothetical protein
VIQIQDKPDRMKGVTTIRQSPRPSEILIIWMVLWINWLDTHSGDAGCDRMCPAIVWKSDLGQNRVAEDDPDRINGVTPISKTQWDFHYPDSPLG